ncbi:MAG: hypothetical protein OHK0013_09410 [Sandaracinaceae bacterium]
MRYVPLGLPFVIATLTACDAPPTNRRLDAGLDAETAATDALPAPDAFSTTDAANPDTGLRPAGRILEIWNELGAGEGPLGYPLVDRLTDANCAWQPFERGTMIWLEARSIAAGCIEFCEVPRLFALEGAVRGATMGAPYHQDPDTWMGPDPFSCAEANRMEVPIMGYTKPLGPVRGFGKVWCENAAVMAGMGAATAPELGGEGFSRCESQQFQGGLVIHNPNADHRAYWVLFGDRSWRRFPE